jgi:hypothetical protein
VRYALSPKSRAPTYLVDRCLHIIVDAALRYATECGEGMVVRVEQHLVGLGQVGPHEEGAAVAQLEVRDLELGADAIDLDPVLAPVELECLAGGKLQGNISLIA